MVPVGGSGLAEPADPVFRRVLGSGDRRRWFYNSLKTCLFISMDRGRKLLRPHGPETFNWRLCAAIPHARRGTRNHEETDHGRF